MPFSTGAASSLPEMGPAARARAFLDTSCTCVGPCDGGVVCPPSRLLPGQPMQQAQEALFHAASSDRASVGTLLRGTSA
jgi:hypothetical protein